MPTWNLGLRLRVAYLIWAALADGGGGGTVRAHLRGCLRQIRRIAAAAGAALSGGTPWTQGTL